jgi:transcription antitermination factor NusA-like protein
MLWHWLRVEVLINFTNEGNIIGKLGVNSRAAEQLPDTESG